MLSHWRYRRRCRRAARQCNRESLGTYFLASEGLTTDRLENTPLISVDLEMTGLDARENQIVAIGWTFVDGGRVHFSSNQHLLIKTGKSVAESLGTKYSEPVKFTDSPYMSGYVLPGNLERLKNAPVISIQKIGSGKLVSHHENMTFRGIWLGTNKLFSNAVFFGEIIH